MNRNKIVWLVIAVVLLGFIAWLILSGKNESDNPFAVPRSGVGTDTFAVARLDLKRLAAFDEAHWRLIESGDTTPSGTGASSLHSLVDTFVAQGVSQVVVPLNVGASTFDGLGIYLGGVIKISDEDIESAILASNSSKAVKAMTLLSSVSNCAGGWRFWGVGEGNNSASDRTVARHYEDIFKAGGAAVFQVVILGASHGSSVVDGKIAPGTPRIVRQFRRLRTAAKGMDSFRVALNPDTASAEHLSWDFAAVFEDNESAQKFVSSWRNLAQDIALTAGPSGDPGLLDKLLAPLITKLTTTLPTAQGRMVSWQ